MTHRHREIERQFTDLLRDNDLPQPDRIDYEERAVGFVFEDAKTIVYVDFDEDAPSKPPLGLGIRL